MISLVSVTTSFCWLRTNFSPHISRYGALLYAFFPYNLFLLYLNYHIAVLLTLALAPLCLLAIDRINQKKWHFIIALSFSFALMIGSHLLTALAITPIISAYALWRCKGNVYAILIIAAGGLIAIGLSALYWLPTIANKPYLIDSGLTTGHFNYRNNFIHPYGFIYGTVFILLPLIAILISYFKDKKATPNLKLNMGSFFWLGALVYSFFMASSLSLPIWNASPLMENFHFPFRFLMVTAPALVYLCCTQENIGTLKQITILFITLAVVGGSSQSLGLYATVPHLELWSEKHILSHPSHAIMRALDTSLPYGHFDMEMQAIAIASSSLAILLLVSFLLYRHSRNQRHDQNLR
jgi:hypothetical protein